MHTGVPLGTHTQDEQSFRPYGKRERGEPARRRSGVLLSFPLPTNTRDVEPGAPPEATAPVSPSEPARPNQCSPRATKPWLLSSRIPSQGALSS